MAWRAPAPGSEVERRTFGVEEELLLVDTSTLRPVPLGERIAASAPGFSGAGHRLSTELKQEQLEIIGPPQTSYQGQLDSIRTGRALADAAASALDAHVVALSTSPWPAASSLVPDNRYQRISDRYAMTAVEQLTCGLHVHVSIASPDEGVAALDRIRVWLPVVLALSANSPFWMGQDTGFASYRYQAWSLWATSGPTDVFGSVDAYREHRDALLRSGVPLDDAMLYFDARLSAHHPTVEVRVSDACLLPSHAAAIATLIRALVETSVRQWRAGLAAPAVSVSLLRAWSWQASRFGLDSELISPLTGAPTGSAEVVAELLQHVGPVLKDFGEDRLVASVIGDILHHGTGATHQRSAHRRAHAGTNRGHLKVVVREALRLTHETVPATGARRGTGAGHGRTT